MSDPHTDQPKGMRGIRAYLDWIDDQPMLSRERELELTRAVRDTGNQAAEEELVRTHLRVVAKEAQRYSRGRIALEDLLAEGTLGLIKGIRRFDPELGYRLSTFVRHDVTRAISEFSMAHERLVRIGTTPNQKKLFFNLEKAKRFVGAPDGVELTPDHASRIATELGVKPSEVISFDRFASRRDASLNAPLRFDDLSCEHQDMIADEHSDTAEIDERRDAEKAMAAVEEVLSSLPERESDIFRRRMMSEKPATLDELSNEYGVSREWVRQIGNKTLDTVTRRAREILEPRRH